VSSTAVLFIYAVGAALLGFWAVARYPAIGPQTFRSALLVTVAAFALQSEVPVGVAYAIASGGPAVALIFVVLPAFTLLFWASGCLVRSLVTLMAPHRH
jgi:hypothetical protein